MLTRRGFFRRFGGLIAALAIAPEIAFSRKLDLPQFDLREIMDQVYWFHSHRHVRVQSAAYLSWKIKVMGEKL